MYCSLSQSVLDITILIQCIELDDLTLLIEGIRARLCLFLRVVHPTDALQESVRRDNHVVSHAVFEVIAVGLYVFKGDNARIFYPGWKILIFDVLCDVTEFLIRTGKI